MSEAHNESCDVTVVAAVILDASRDMARANDRLMHEHGMPVDLTACCFYVGMQRA